jgi:hypothetical protein
MWQWLKTWWAEVADELRQEHVLEREYLAKRAALHERLKEKRNGKSFPQ